MKAFARIFLIVLIIILPIVVIASWVVGAYNPDVKSLLEDAGVRWSITHITKNFSDLPLAEILLLMVTVSVVRESGWLSWLYPKNHPLTLKQLRAYTYTNLLIFALFLIFLLVLFMPASPLRNSFGELSHSPLSQGWLSLLSLLFIIVSNVYGYLSGRFVTSADFAFAHTRVLRNFSPAFISLFFLGQIMGCLDYSQLITFSSSEVRTAIIHTLIILCFIR